MRILITGAAGNLGEKLSRHLAGDHELVLLDIKVLPESNIHPIDLSSDVESWSHLFEGVDVVVHLAANGYFLAEWTDLIQPNIDAVLNVYEACAQHNVPRVMFASSNFVLYGYENNDSVSVLNSKTPPLPNNDYGASKLFGERVGRQFSIVKGITTISVRIGWNPPGTAVGPFGVSDWFRRMWISDRDFCQLMDCCISASSVPKYSVINGVSANSDSVWDLLEAREMLGYHPVDDAFDLCWQKKPV